MRLEEPFRECVGLGSDEDTVGIFRFRGDEGLSLADEAGAAFGRGG